MPRAEVLAPEIARLRALVAGSGLTQADLADRAGMTPANLSRLLSGRKSPQLDTVRRVLVALGSEDWADLGPIAQPTPASSSAQKSNSTGTTSVG